MTRTERTASTAALLALAACSAAQSGPPRPDAIEPAYGFAGSATLVEIRGTGFAVKPVQELDARGSRVEGAFRAWLGATELDAVQWIDGGRLTARVPAGLAPGLHDLAVEGPFGRGALPGSFRVLAGAAPALRVGLQGPDRVSVGQRFALAVHVSNDGDGPLVEVAPALGVGGALALREPPTALTVALAAGETAVFTWDVEALAPGDAEVTADAVATDSRLPSAPVRAAGAATVHVDLAARIEASLEVTPTIVNEGQAASVRMAVRNVGEATALDVAPGPLVQTGEGAAALPSGPLPASATIPGGGTAWFEWRVAGSRAGEVAFSAGADGVDANSGAPVRAAAAAAPAVLVLRPAALTARLDGAARVNVGQSFRVDLEIANAGDSAAIAVTADVSGSPASAVIPGTAPAACDVAGGTTRTVARAFTAAEPGAASIAAWVAGTDATAGDAVAAGAPDLAIVVERPAALSATLEVPASLSLQAFTVTMTVVNLGDAAASDVLPGPLALAPASTAAASLVDGPAFPAAIPGGGRATFTWTYRTERIGTLQLQGSVTGTDRNDGGARSAQALSNVADVRDAVRVVASDPLSDGSPFAFVTGYRGELYVGPNRTGSRLARIGFAGGPPVPLALSFAADTVPSNVSANTARPYTSIGYTDCQTNSLANACGPDNEDGRGLLTSVRFGGEEWLVIGGAKSGGDLDYVHLARGTTSPLEFWYVDLSSALGGNTRGFSAALASADRLYLGFSDNGGNRPYGIALLAPPAAPGSNAVLGTHALDLDLAEAFKKTGGGFGSVTLVDTIAEVAGRLYLFSDVGCIVATSATPATKDDFVSCSPSPSLAYDERQSVEPTRQHDLEPRERAWPQAAVWRGRLYAIRNTYAGPQLWGCDPGTGLDPVVCEPGDWALVAGDAGNLTRFGYATATAATLLVATPAHLYVGLDDAVRGIHLFKTDVDRPALASDFTGRDGCTAGTAGCEGVGGDGAGAPSVLHRIFDAEVVPSPDGRSDVYLTAGDGSAPVRVLSLPQ